MKYVVEVNGELHEVTADTGGAQTNGVAGAATLREVPGTPLYVMSVGDQVYRVVVRRSEGRGRFELDMGGYRYVVEALDQRTRAIRELSAAAAGPAGPAPLTAPMPGLIVRVNVQPGDVVESGQGLVVMEAMKMENELRSAAAGRVRTVRIEAGQAVEKGTVLVELE